MRGMDGIGGFEEFYMEDVAGMPANDSQPQLDT
jgi:hypothetical protein